MACVLCVPSVIEIVIKSLARRRLDVEWEDRGRTAGETTTAGDYRKSQFMALRGQINWECVAELVTIYVLQEAGRLRTHRDGEDTHDP